MGGAYAKWQQGSETERKRAKDGFSGICAIGTGLLDYAAFDGTSFPIAKQNSVRSCSLPALRNALSQATHNSEALPHSNGVECDLFQLVEEVASDLEAFGCSGERVVVHLLSESFTAFHIDADEHVSATNQTTQLSLGVPLGCLTDETAGIVIPGAREVFTFSMPREVGTQKVIVGEPSSSLGIPLGFSGTETGTPSGRDVSELARRERRDLLSCTIGDVFTSRLQMKLRLDHNLMMQGGSTVKPKHTKIYKVMSDGFCLLRALHYPQELSHTEMRGIVRRIVSASLKESDTFVNRVVSLSSALEFYIGFLETGVPEWVSSLSKDLTKLQENENRMLNTLANMGQLRQERAEWDARIIEACTRNRDDTSSTDGDGLLLWLCEGELGPLSIELGFNIRCWRTVWSHTMEESAWSSYDVDSYELVAVYHTTGNGNISDAASACVDIVHSGDHFDRLVFCQERFHPLQLDVKQWPSLRQSNVEHLRDTLKKLAVLQGSVVESKLLCALDGEVGLREGRIWKERGAGASGSRLSSEFGTRDAPLAKRTRRSGPQ